MDLTVYLPDEIGKRAKSAKLNFSRLLRDDVTTELERRKTVSKTLDKPQEFKLDLETKDGGQGYVGRITGALIADDERGECSVYLTNDERVIVYDWKRLDYHEIDDVSALRDWLEDDEAYFAAMNALGEEPEPIDL